MSEKELFPIPPAPDEWKEFLFKKEHWKPGESAWAVAKSWHKARGVPSKIAGLLGKNVKLIGMRPEYKVSMGRGGGRGGMIRCDVFAHVEADERTCALVIEAKVDGEFGKVINKWIIGDKDKPGSGPNHERRMAKICDVLGVDFSLCGDKRFQFFSQTLAAVIMAERLKTDMAAMIVQSFSSNDSGYHDFLDFCDLFGVQPSIDGISKASVPNGPPLLLGWAKCPLPKE